MRGEEVMSDKANGLAGKLEQQGGEVAVAPTGEPEGKGKRPTRDPE